MYYNKRKIRSLFAMLMVFLLVLTPFTSFAESTNAANSSEMTTLKEQNETTAAEKIDSSVMKQLEDEKYADVLIELTEQVDTSEVAAVAKQQLGSDSTAYNQKMAARHAVVETLRTTAETTQQPLLTTLEKSQEQGEVKDIESFYIMNVISVKATKDVIERLSYSSDVARIKDNDHVDIIHPEKPEDPISSPAVNNDEVEWNIDQVLAPDAWNEFGVTGEGIVVGVIDTGVQWDHEALKENFRGYDPEDPDNPDATGNWLDATGSSELPADTHGHGTHVTGTVMGQGPDETNIVGVAPDAEWIAARAFTAAGGTEAALLASGEFMLAPNGDPDLAPDIVQNSWGGQPGVDEWYRPMVQAWRDAGQLPVFSAGNSGPGAETVTPPSNYPESYAVAATDSNNGVASFSSRGPSQYDDQKPNISAPGVNIRSSVPGGGYEGGWNGTSMASPHISGVAAMLLSIDASLSPDEIEEIMDETATPLTDDQYSDVPNDGYGVGLVNAYEAVAMIADGTGFVSGQVLSEGSDEEPPTIEHTPLDFSFSGMDLPVTAEISDDVAVVEAEVIVSHEEFDEDISIDMSLTSGDHLDGTYEATIPHMYAMEPGFDYQIFAHDFGGNTTSTDVNWVDIEFGIVPDEYSEDFEEFPLGWTMGGSWEWGEPSGDSPDPVVGDNVIGTNLAGNYPPNAADTLVLPPIDLRDSDAASLSLSHWYDIEAGWDYGYVNISSDFGETWETIETISQRGQEWENLYIDLNEYVGSDDPIFVAFELTSDAIIEYLGWYLDDVELQGADTEAPDAPTELEATASSTGITLSWTASEAADTAGYNVYRSTTSGSDFEKIGDTSSTQFNDNTGESGETYYYVVTAFDYSGNESDYSNETSAAPPEIEVLFHTDFDENDGDFTTDGENNSWEWGEPTSGPEEAFAGENLLATNLSGDYNNNEDSWMMSPEMELNADLTTAELNFTYWQNIENNFDYGYVEVTADGGSTWDTLTSYTDVFETWNTEAVSLNDYIGETIQFRFALETDGSVTRPGWYIDDVYVLGSFESTDDVVESPSTERVSIDSSREKVGPQSTFEHTLQNDASSYEFEKVSGGATSVLSEDGLPVDGTVTIVETDRTTQTDPTTGEYTIRSSATEDGETVTVLAEAYGFHPAEASVTVEEDETTYQNFMLDPLATGDIEGTVTNDYTEEPVEGASLRIIEDPNVPVAYTDDSGAFTMEGIYEGDYTVRVSAEGYHPNEFDVTVEDGEVFVLDVALEQFVGYEDEIAYDNGQPENALVLNAAGNGLAVKFTPEDGMAELRGVNMFIHGDDFPVPGGNEINIVVYDTDDNGNPNEQVIEPVLVEVDRGEWNYIDLSDHGFVTEDDFFISTLQDEIGDYSPAVGTDEEQPNAERSYLNIGGSFEPHFDNGNFMIRANVAYSLDAPTLTSPEDGMFTSEDSIEVTGEFAGDGDVTVYNNGEEAAVADMEDGAFSATIDLEEGDNEIFAEGDAEGIPLPSDSVTVIKDSIDPDVTIDSPVDGSVTGNEVINVEGSVDDENLASIAVNGEDTEFAEDGSFSKQIIVEEGENTFTVEAVDHAGNSTTEEVTVYVDWTDPSIENIEPAEDMEIEPGDTVTVSFESDSEGGEASFTVSIPSGNQPAAINEMEEVEPGFYEGTWTAPEGNFENAEVNISMTDAAGNHSTATADGTITVAEEPMTAEELYHIIDRLEEDGEINKRASSQLTGALENAVDHYNNGREKQAFSQLDRFLSIIDGNHMRDASEEVKELLRDSVNELREEWS
ncbi:S8 family serine peptidase [Salipaludibacillus daqingensis]|uniref:S8 family serine peptidase n=1 Tax=Salipaludibacillus daqingensis TaxID=3041001 RepID=UPI002474955D|nr:S8 family serine peptidase [Salipaludibacillus daqingensis]